MSGSILFPPSPAPGDTHQGWIWDSVAWNSRVLTGQGVTDGSEAAPGDVGEFISHSVGNVASASAINTVTATLNLSAGDWDISGHCSFAPWTPITQAILTFSDQAGGVGAGGIDGGRFSYFLASMPSTAATVHLNVGPARLSVTGPRTIYLVGQGLGGQVTLNGTARARRVR